FPELSAKLDEVGAKYGVSSRAAVVTAWILRHPAFVQVLTGTSNVEHFAEQCEYDKIDMTRTEWYEIYKAAGNTTTL
ncbi:MAG: aldo/keto reductase family oxidoreductase, partial [Lachnospiraceae bacterium]|nr:aldo/keto reductase family oxidoreductase [Lachnospiraceae bacterium]